MIIDKEEIILSNYIIDPTSSDIEQFVNVVKDVVVRATPAKNGKNLGSIGEGKYSYKSVKEVGENTWVELDDNKWILLDDSAELGSAELDTEVDAEFVDVSDEDVNEIPQDVIDDTEVDDKIEVDDNPVEKAESIDAVQTTDSDRQDAWQTFHVGDVVCIKESATSYIGGQPIPDSCKGVKLYIRGIQPSKCKALVSREKFANKFVGRVHTNDLQLF